MKRYQFLLTLLSAGALSLTTLTGTTFAQRNDRDDRTPYQTKTFSGNINAVRAETSGGSLTVEGGTDRNAKVEMFVRSNNGNDNLDKAEIEERLRDYDISIDQEGSTIVATAKRRGNGNNNDWKRSLSISFKFYTPRTVATDLRTSGGSINLSQLSGKQRFRTSGGSLNVTDVEGDINGQTSGGSIHLDRCRTKDRMDLQTSGSDLTGEIKAGTSGGSVRLANVSGSVDASTSAGSVEVSIVKLGEYVRLSTSVGSVRVDMPLNKGMDLNLSGSRVSIPSSLSKFDGDIEKNRVRGRLNGGGVAVNISAGMGNVYVNQ